ncbi:hypothetical protein K1X76_00115 [bacterium]|nr:hypothetical protein [bacterium]
MGTDAINGLQTPWYFYENESVLPEKSDPAPLPLFAPPFLPQATEGLAVNAARFARLPKIPGPWGLALAAGSLGTVWYLSGSEEDINPTLEEPGFTPYEDPEVDLENPETKIKFSPLSDPATTIGQPPSAPVVIIPRNPEEPKESASEEIMMSADNPESNEQHISEKVSDLTELNWKNNTSRAKTTFPKRVTIMLDNGNKLTIQYYGADTTKSFSGAYKYHLVRQTNGTDGKDHYYLYLIRPTDAHMAGAYAAKMADRIAPRGIAAGWIRIDESGDMLVDGQSGNFPTQNDQYFGEATMFSHDDVSGLDPAVQYLSQFFSIEKGSAKPPGID